MIKQQQAKGSLFDTHATYVICVMGEVGQQWLEYYDKISILVTEAPDLSCTSMICLRNCDQAALVGLLNHLYDYQYPITFLERLVDNPN